ncbi:MAG: hypothetical protein AAFU83_04215, partial [Bacteroidota bacterium]
MDNKPMDEHEEDKEFKIVRGPMTRSMRKAQEKRQSKERKGFWADAFEKHQESVFQQLAKTEITEIDEEEEGNEPRDNEDISKAERDESTQPTEEYGKERRGESPAHGGIPVKREEDAAAISAIDGPREAESAEISPGVLYNSKKLESVALQDGRMGDILIRGQNTTTLGANDPVVPNDEQLYSIDPAIRTLEKEIAVRRAQAERNVLALYGSSGADEGNRGPHKSESNEGMERGLPTETPRIKQETGVQGTFRTGYPATTGEMSYQPYSGPLPISHGFNSGTEGQRYAPRSGTPNWSQGMYTPKSYEDQRSRSRTSSRKPSETETRRNLQQNHTPFKGEALFHISEGGGSQGERGSSRGDYPVDEGRAEGRFTANQQTIPRQEHESIRFSIMNLGPNFVSYSGDEKKRTFNSYIMQLRSFIALNDLTPRETIHLIHISIIGKANEY